MTTLTNLIEDRKFCTKKELLEFLRVQQKIALRKEMIQSNIKEKCFWEGRATAFALAADLLEMTEI